MARSLFWRFNVTTADGAARGPFFGDPVADVPPAASVVLIGEQEPQRKK